MYHTSPSSPLLTTQVCTDSVLNQASFSPNSLEREVLDQDPSSLLQGSLSISDQAPLEDFAGLASSFPRTKQNVGVPRRVGNRRRVKRTTSHSNQWKDHLSKVRTTPPGHRPSNAHLTQSRVVLEAREDPGKWRRLLHNKKALLAAGTIAGAVAKELFESDAHDHWRSAGRILSEVVDWLSGLSS